MPLPSPSYNQHEWNRLAKQLIDPRISGYPFPPFDTAPSGVNAGFTYFDTATTKVRTWDGSAWQDHW